MRGRRLAAAGALVLAASLMACGEPTHFGTVEEAARHFGADPETMLQIDELRFVAVLRTAPASAELFGFFHEAAGWRRSLAVARATDAHRETVFLTTRPADDPWFGSMAWGTAGANVARVTLDRPGEQGGVVVNGTWVVRIPDPGLSPQTLGWRFLAADGTPVLIGTGEVPPQP